MKCSLFYCWWSFLSWFRTFFRFWTKKRKKRKSLWNEKRSQEIEEIPLKLKIFENDQQSKELFEHKKNIYFSLSFSQHKNIFSYFSYSNNNQLFYLHLNIHLLFRKKLFNWKFYFKWKRSFYNIETNYWKSPFFFIKFLLPKINSDVHPLLFIEIWNQKIFFFKILIFLIINSLTVVFMSYSPVAYSLLF